MLYYLCEKKMVIHFCKGTVLIDGALFFFKQYKYLYQVVKKNYSKPLANTPKLYTMWNIHKVC